MSRTVAGTTREEEALAEVAGTSIDRGWAGSIVAFFLLFLLTGWALEVTAAVVARPNLLRGEAALAFPPPGELGTLWRQKGPLALADRLKQAGIETQERLDRDSQLAAAVRPRLQSLLSFGLRYGNSQVLIGGDGWLFFRDDFDYLTGPPFLAPAALARRARAGSPHRTQHPDPLTALLGLAADLQAHGVGFVVVPVPTKLGIAWERYLGRKSRGGPAIANLSRDELIARLQAAGVAVFDPAPILRTMELQGEKPYMRYDSHWSPAGLDRTAAGLAGFLADRFDLGAVARFHRQPRSLDRRADLADLLGLDPERNPYLIEPLEILTVDGPGERPFNSRRNGGRVLLLGDSFSRLLIRNKRKGGDANFAAQLAFHLQRPVDMLAENDAGADFARRVEWLRQPQALDGRSVVVLEVAERALALGDWTPARLGTPQP